MQKNKLFELFEALSATEKTALRKFVHSPLHNKREDVHVLLAYLESLSEAELRDLEKEQLFSKIYPSEVYSKENDVQLRYVMSFLLKLIEDFLVLREATHNPMQNQLNLARVYRRLHLNKHFGQTLSNVRKMQENALLRDLDYYENAYRIEEEEYLFTRYTQRNTPKNLQSISDVLDIQFIVAKLKQGCLLHSQQTVYKTSYQTGLLNAVLNHVDHHPSLLEHPAIAIYYYNYLAATQENGEDFFKAFQQQLLAAPALFPAHELRDLYQFAINYCIRQLNLQKGDYQQYFRVMFDLYESGLKHAFLIEDGQLSPFAFKNIVSTALWLKEFDWTAKFIEDYQNFLENSLRETYVSFSLAKLCFERQEYPKALSLLQKVEYSDIFLNLSAKLMLLKIYYQMQEYDVLESFLTSFKTYVSRKKQSGQLRSYHQENYLNIIHFTQKLLSYNPYNKKEKEQLQKSIESTEVLTERDWLLEQLA